MAEKIKIVTKKIKDITPYWNNPRKNEKAIDAVMHSIEEFGFKNPIIIDKEGVIISGHTRRLAAIKLGLKEVPCIVGDHLTESQVKAFRLADNRVSEIATWDDDLLKEDLNSNLKLFRNKQDREAIEVDDKYILRDVDTDEEYKELLKEKKL